MRDTREKIMDATMRLIMEKGYSDTTTLEIAAAAGVSEATIFRRFGSKKEIVLTALEGNKWVPRLDASVFSEPSWELEADLTRFMGEYCKRVTPDMVRLSIGLRSPQLYSETAPYILKLPVSFVSPLEGYFKTMRKKGKIRSEDPHALAMTLFSATFGFVFLQASFGKVLSPMQQEEYIRSSVRQLVHGIT